MLKGEVKNFSGQLIMDDDYNYGSYSQSIPALKVAFLGGDNFPDSKYQIGRYTTILGHAKLISKTSKTYNISGTDFQEAKGNG